MNTYTKTLLVIALLATFASQGVSVESVPRVSANTMIEGPESEDTATLPLRYTSGIRSIYEDSKGRFWFGSHEEGVCLLEGDTFTYYTTEDGLSGNQIRTIQEDRTGLMWFATESGISSFDGITFRSYTGKNTFSPAAITGVAWRKEAGDLWFPGDSGLPANTNDGQGVYRYDNRTLEYLAFPIPQDSAAENTFRVTSIVESRDGRIWFGTYSAVFEYDGHSFTIIDNSTKGIGPDEEDLHVRSLFEDSSGTLWIGNNGLGVMSFDGQALSNFSELHGLSIREKGPTGSLGRVFSIAEDASGNMWFGTRDNGVWCFDGTSMRNFRLADGLTSLMVWAIYRDKRDSLWLGMGDGSVCRFNGTSFEKIY